MKTSFFACVAVWSAFAQLATLAAESEWISPDSAKTVQLTSEDTATGKIDYLFIGGQKLPLLGHSPIRRENHGFGWLAGASGTWIDNRYLIFEDDMGLGIVDTQLRLILVNQVFTGHTKAPGAPKWAAIKYRPTSRNQEQMQGDEKDKLLFISPESLSAKSAASSEETPFDHIDSVTLDGIALARPSWTPDNKGLVVATHANQKIKATLFDAETHEVKAIVPIVGLTLSKEQLLSPWFSPDVEGLVKNAIKESNLLSTAAPTKTVPQTNNPPPSVQPAAPKKALEAKPATPSEEPTSSTPWSIIVVLIVAAIGLLWLLVKKRK